MSGTQPSTVSHVLNESLTRYSLRFFSFFFVSSTSQCRVCVRCVFPRFYLPAKIRNIAFPFGCSRFFFPALPCFICFPRSVEIVQRHSLSFLDKKTQSTFFHSKTSVSFLPDLVPFESIGSDRPGIDNGNQFIDALDSSFRPRLGKTFVKRRRIPLDSASR